MMTMFNPNSDDDLSQWWLLLLNSSHLLGIMKTTKGHIRGYHQRPKMGGLSLMVFPIPQPSQLCFIPDHTMLYFSLVQKQPLWRWVLHNPIWKEHCCNVRRVNSLQTSRECQKLTHGWIHFWEIKIENVVLINVCNTTNHPYNNGQYPVRSHRQLESIRAVCRGGDPASLKCPPLKGWESMELSAWVKPW